MSFPSLFSALETRWRSVSSNRSELRWRGVTVNLKGLGCAVLLITTSGLWTMPVIMTPPAAQAYTARVNVAIERQSGESYTALLRRAELVARAAAQRSFDRDILINDVAIFIIAENSGVEVPLLTLNVSRPQWRSRPDPRVWAIYYKTAKTLLGLDNVTPPGRFRITPTAVPTPSPTPQPTPAAQPLSPLPPGRVNPNAPTQTQPTAPKGASPVPQSSPGGVPLEEDEEP